MLAAYLDALNTSGGIQFNAVYFDNFSAFVGRSERLGFSFESAQKKPRVKPTTKESAISFLL